MIVTYPEGQTLERYYLCSDCWERLIMHPADGNQMRDVRCDTPGCTCNGFVSRRYVESEEARQITKKREVARALAGKLDWIKPVERPSIAQALKELGF